MNIDKNHFWGSHQNKNHLFYPKWISNGAKIEPKWSPNGAQIDENATKTRLRKDDYFQIQFFVEFE